MAPFAITINYPFYLYLDERVLGVIALILLAGTLFLWFRAYARSRANGWLLLAVGAVVAAGGNVLEISYLWLVLGGFLVWAGSLVLCRDLRRPRSGKP